MTSLCEQQFPTTTHSSSSSTCCNPYHWCRLSGNYKIGIEIRLSLLLLMMYGVGGYLEPDAQRWQSFSRFWRRGGGGWFPLFILDIQHSLLPCLVLDSFLLFSFLRYYSKRRMAPPRPPPTPSTPLFHCVSVSNGPKETKHAHAILSPLLSSPWIEQNKKKSRLSTPCVCVTLSKHAIHYRIAPAPVTSKPLNGTLNLELKKKKKKKLSLECQIRVLCV